ncbi:hypothetical protein DQ238_14165 [Geodermatophilus sp. TF02-6]|uniref:hypothetical protein n=1 Tax=Geodermatophilus sp. TF02-6 TaxID=2250575 RepID=UPI000DEAE799|nr:hypothetical protein [Geodermatophilus sp. TF02-6]RBY77804.1 hypothetical protein DQ238_14165 [Geodermatophilus sp. TF02-6]
MSGLRRLTTGLLLAVCAAAALTGVVSGPAATTDLAEAADTGQFRAGNIISDQLFFDGAAMSAGDVQAFLDSRNPACVAGSDGTPCLKNYRQDTWTRAADGSCAGTYRGAAQETAATIIAKVGQACGISQRVLLVLLQKEQSLVTASGSGLTATRYRSATGYGCPDTAACDSQYYGFFNQVYSAASRYRYYASNPTRFNHRAGVVNQVRYHPDAACGSSAVLIENQATAGLYNYTPYQPNAAALAAGKGTGDSCSAYGNRNFWIYFTDWFGSTQVPGASQVATRYAATGGVSGPLGGATANVVCGLRDGGCFQSYAKGAVYWSPATGARVVSAGPVYDKWASLGWERGGLGYPTSDTGCGLAGGGCFQHFTGGSIYWSPATGAHTVGGAIRDRWAGLNWEYSALGYPTSDWTTTPDGAAQYVHFQTGSIYWSAATGARVLSGAVYDKWASTGWETSPLGLPTSDVTATPDGRGRYAHFQRGSVYWSAATGGHTVGGAIRERWAATGWEGGALGYPTSDWTTTPNGQAQYVHFQGGSVYWSPASGARWLTGRVYEAWAAGGWESGPLGLPTTDTATTPDGRAQYAHFQHGSIYVTSSGAHLLRAAVVTAWARTGWERGPLGYPTAATGSGEQLPAGAAVQTFEGGAVYVSPSTGGHAVTADLLAAYRAAGGSTGTLGLPTSDPGTTPDGVARYQHFGGGSIYATAATGTRVLTAVVRDAWAASGWERGPLGYPTTDTAATPDGLGRYTHFQRGSVYWTRATGAHLLTGAVLDAWARTGWEAGVLRYPTTDVTTTPDGQGRYAHFQDGAIYSSPAGGTRVLRGAVLAAWGATGWEQGRLGYPTGDLETVTGGTSQRFQGGRIDVSSATGVAAVHYT